MRILLTLALACGALFAQEQAAPKADAPKANAPKADAPPRLVKYYMAFLKKGPKWDTPPPKAELDELGKGHMGHLVAMHAAGKLLLAGPFGDNGDIRGILIFKGTDSMEEMKAFAEQDPTVKAGRMIVEIHPWYAEPGHIQ